MTKPSAELAAFFAPVLTWLDAGGDERQGLNMFSFINSDNENMNGRLCETTFCIAGAVGAFNAGLSFENVIEVDSDDDISLRDRAWYAEDALVENHGMSAHDQAALFHEYPGDRATPQVAAAVIRHWIETGDVDWDLALEKAA